MERRERVKGNVWGRECKKGRPAYYSNRLKDTPPDTQSSQRLPLLRSDHCLHKHTVSPAKSGDSL